MTLKSLTKTIGNLFLFLALFFSASLTAQGLNAPATELKDSQNPIYDSMKERAISKWRNDHAMIVYEINTQAKAFQDIGVLLINENNSPEALKLFYSCVLKWSNGEVDPQKGVLNNSTVDWAMVHYEFKNQLKAKKSY